MSNELVRSKAKDAALSVSYDVLGTHVELDLQFVKEYLVRGRADLTTDQELVFFMNTCKMQKLNPLAQGEVFLIKYSKDDPAQMVVGKDAYLRRAFDHPDYLYKKDGIVVLRGKDIVQKEGCCLYPGEELIGGWCRVHFLRQGKEREAFKEVAFSEYNKGMANWKSKPATMINKVAISQCVRDAFPKDYEGLYSEEEMVASGAIPADYTVIPSTGEVVDDMIITQEQRKALFKAACSAFGDEANATLKQMIEDRGFESTAEMPLSAYNAIMADILKIAEPSAAADTAAVIDMEPVRSDTKADKQGDADQA